MTLWVVGDVQGYLEPLKRVLYDVGLLNDDGRWSGGDTVLAVLGDLVDKGPDGVGVIDFLLRLAPHVTVVLGNHDVLLLAARKFPEQFEQRWRESGGIDTDLQRLTNEHVQWLTQLPAIVKFDNALMLHADALFYLEYGQTIETVNAGIRGVLQSDDPEAWTQLLDRFGEHRAFLTCANVDRMLRTYRGSRIIHGHTPVPRLVQQPAETVASPYVYCDGRCVNVDPGIYLGGPGFAYRLTP